LGLAPIRWLKLKNTDALKLLRKTLKMLNHEKRVGVIGTG
tara:strand:- start:47 stop:166 length:120 start_codon:yes stop_codon:yes gene_type:complete